jgi:hypothetical protein
MIHHSRLQIQTPAEIPPPAFNQEVEMTADLILLLAIVMVIGIEVKIIIKRK